MIDSLSTRNDDQRSTLHINANGHYDPNPWSSSPAPAPAGSGFPFSYDDLLPSIALGCAYRAWPLRWASPLGPPGFHINVETNNWII